MKVASEPWSTPKADAAFRKWVREEHRRCREQNPALMRRLRRLSDDELLRLEIEVLERSPSAPLAAYRLRTARDILALRSAPKLPIKRRRLVAPEHRSAASVQDAGGGLGGGLAPPSLPAPPAATAAPEVACPEPAAPPPDNVIRPYFGPKAFGVGREAVWIGGEV